jgi:hypothetical protein
VRKFLAIEAAGQQIACFGGPANSGAHAIAALSKQTKVTQHWAEHHLFRLLPQRVGEIARSLWPMLRRVDLRGPICTLPAAHCSVA